MKAFKSPEPVTDPMEALKQGIFKIGDQNTTTLPYTFVEVQRLLKRPILETKRELTSEEEEEGDRLTPPASPPQTMKSNPKQTQSTSSQAATLNSAEYEAYLPGAPGIHLTQPTTLARRQELYSAVINQRSLNPGLPKPTFTPLDLSSSPGSELLSELEFQLCCILRLAPGLYFHARKTLIDAFYAHGWYNKSRAQKLLRIDVNKTGRLWEFMVYQGWIAKEASSLKDPPHTIRI